MAVGIDSVGGRGESAGGTTFTCSVTVSGSNSNRALIVTVAWETSGPITVTGVATDLNSGASFTSVGSHANNPFGTHIFRLLNPDSGTHTITVTTSGSVINRANAHAFSLYDVNQTTPTQNFTSSINVSSLTVNTTSGNFTVLATAGNGGVSGITPGTTASSAGGCAYAYDQPSGSTSAYSWSGGAIFSNSGCDVVASGGATTYPTYAYAQQ